MACHLTTPRKNAVHQVKLIGLDFGSTTSSAIVARASMGRSCITGRMKLGHPEILYRSFPVFTPFADGVIDESRIRRYMDQWLSESDTRLEDIFAGGTIITGLAALRSNAQALARLVSRRIGEAVIATADDPSLESWLAFMGSCSVLSRFHCDTPIINLDIGGGTTNPAIGLNGNVQSTGCYYVGARHFRFEPGSYRLQEESEFGRQLLTHLAIPLHAGEVLCPQDRDRILDFYIKALEAMVMGTYNFFDQGIGRIHEQVRFEWSCPGMMPVVTFSGGVGELIYQHAAGETLPGTTYFGDLGIDLARRVVASPVLAAGLGEFVPENRGRATVYGLALHSTDISGTTLYLPDTDMLPLRDLPILARLPLNADSEEWLRALELLHKGSCGGCVQLISELSWDPNGKPSSLAEIKAAGQRLTAVLKERPLTGKQTLVLVISDNAGKTLGSYATNWGQLPLRLIVIDEIPDRHAHFVNIGRCLNNIVPVSFYGMN
ncbi:MAG: reactivating factor for ethanolamine ammonia lyase [Deltaproteobacteria bacterium]|nr:MAG: reactivating factor for ethanolamine ammonia lyase [Deltaproteobacteria bacterium]